ncbi:AAA family ATPase [Psychromicrobium sp. YIM B11713]|uniref:AAA family ATPase n=1 Tax=Psychromicrobium sp. YIM B11713 TaxID=3145233 RepID=UPI00374E7E0E
MSLEDQQEAEELAILAAEQTAEDAYWRDYPNRLKGVDWLKHRKPEQALIKGYMPRRGLGQLYGPSYTGKSFVAVDLALSVCAGIDEWMGQPLETQGPQHVVYVAAEGGQVFWDAVEGWLEVHPGADLTRLHVLDGGEADRLILSAEKDSTKHGMSRLVQEMQQLAGQEDIALVVIDPQINVLAGIDENSNVDLMEVLTTLKAWSDSSNTLTILVHHTGHDKSRGRGASAQFGVMDVVLGLRNEGGQRELHFEKVKGMAKPQQPILFNIEHVDIQGGSGRSVFLDVLKNVASANDLAAQKVAEEEQAVAARVMAGDYSAAKISESLNMNRNKVAARLKSLVNSGVLIKGGTTYHPHYSTAPLPSVQPNAATVQP